MSASQLPAEFDRYYTHDEITKFLKQAAKLYPKLTRLTEIGKSYAGKPLWVLEITDTRKGDFADKPAYYIESGIHATEFCGDTVTQPRVGEECDDGGIVNNDGCDSSCIVEFCGDGVRQVALGEECDDGGANSNSAVDACRLDCNDPYPLPVECGEQ